jgi:hypothetical protein
MKRLLWGLPLVLLLGCPLYDENCSGGQECAAGFRCDDYIERCVPIPTLPTCTAPEQCGASETCAPDGECRPGSCDYHGCVAGYTCSIVDGVHACVATSSIGQDAGVSPDQGDAAAISDAAPEPSDAAATPASPDSGTPDASPDAG